MKKIVLVLLVAITLFIFTVSPVFAGGDQVRGDKAEGPAYQIQEQEPCTCMILPRLKFQGLMQLTLV